MNLKTTRPTSDPTMMDMGAISQTPTPKDNYEAFLAFGIKLHMLADEVPDDALQEAEFDRQQENCVAGQAAILNTASHQEIRSLECAQSMMSLWSEEVRQNQDPSDMTDTDRIVLRVFDFFQKTAFFHG